MMNSWKWQPALSDTVHPFPRHVIALATSPKGVSPGSFDVSSEGPQSSIVRRYPVISVVPDDHALQPLSHFGNGVVHSSSQFGFNVAELGSHPLLDGSAKDCVHSVPSFLPADVR